MSCRPLSISPDSSAAPVSPVSSSIVNSSSSGPCTSSLDSRIASMVATPIPLSEPSVVPVALR